MRHLSKALLPAGSLASAGAWLRARDRGQTERRRERTRAPKQRDDGDSSETYKHYRNFFAPAADGGVRTRAPRPSPSISANFVLFRTINALFSPVSHEQVTLPLRRRRPSIALPVKRSFRLLHALDIVSPLPAPLLRTAGLKRHLRHLLPQRVTLRKLALSLRPRRLRLAEPDKRRTRTSGPA